MAHPPIFDFERWFKDTYGPLVKEGQEHLTGYNASYDAIYRDMKRQVLVIYNNGSVSVAGIGVSAEKARPYIGTATAGQTIACIDKYSNFDFERWFKDTYGPLVKEGKHCLGGGYGISYDEMYTTLKSAEWVIKDNGNMEGGQGLAKITATQARPYMGKYYSNRQGGAWALEERGEFMTNLSKWVKSQSDTHGRSEGAIIDAIKGILQ